jgi:hypothetical protein
MMGHEMGTGIITDETPETPGHGRIRRMATA